VEWIVLIYTGKGWGVQMRVSGYPWIDINEVET